MDSFLFRFSNTSFHRFPIFFISSHINCHNMGNLMMCMKHSIATTLFSIDLLIFAVRLCNAVDVDLPGWYFLAHSFLAMTKTWCFFTNPFSLTSQAVLACCRLSCIWLEIVPPLLPHPGSRLWHHVWCCRVMRARAGWIVETLFKTCRFVYDGDLSELFAIR